MCFKSVTFECYISQQERKYFLIPTMAGNMKLVVKMLTGKEIEVEVKKTGKIRDVKEYIYRNTGEN